MSKQQSSFDIQPYKIVKFYSAMAKKIYSLCQFKYIFSYLDMKCRKNCNQIQTFGTKMKENYSFGLLFAIFMNSKFKTLMR